VRDDDDGRDAMGAKDDDDDDARIGT